MVSSGPFEPTATDACGELPTEMPPPSHIPYSPPPPPFPVPPSPSHTPPSEGTNRSSGSGSNSGSNASGSNHRRHKEGRSASMISAQSIAHTTLRVTSTGTNHRSLADGLSSSSPKATAAAASVGSDQHTHPADLQREDALPAAATAVTSSSSAEPPPPLSTPDDSARCDASFKWLVESSWSGGLRARVDVGGEGVVEGWLMRFTFHRSARVTVDDLIGGIPLSDPASHVLLVQARLSAGLGTMNLNLNATMAWEGDGGQDLEPAVDAPLVPATSSTPARTPWPVPWPVAKRFPPPRIECVRAPDGTGATSDDDAWRRSAYEDYLWMAREFNRQYMNSHGKQHPDYQPHSANSELQTHHLNGRLWCFLGSVTTRPSPSLRRLHPTPPSSTLPSQTFAVRPR